MTDRNSGVGPIKDPRAHLEQAFIEEYLRLHGHEPKAVRLLPPDRMKELLEAASTYAAGKLAELEARAHYVHELHSKE